tara:strand:- start:1100 stop:1864 length:765 start_codon:yes stop_codon:yes gene_type:complete
MIPKQIHMTWKNKNLPNFFQNNIDSWKKLNPEYNIIFYDDEKINNFFNKYCQEYLNIINSYDKMINKVDIFKMLVLYYFGGVYVDCDVKCLKPIDELLQNKTFVMGYGPSECNVGIYKNYKLIECAVIASIPNHSIWSTVVLSNLKPLNLQKNKHIPFTTGPVFMTECVEKYIQNFGFNLDDIKEKEYKKSVHIMDSIVFYPINNRIKNRIKKDKIDKTIEMIKNNDFPKESYAVHYFCGSWWKKVDSIGIFKN